MSAARTVRRMKSSPYRIPRSAADLRLLDCGALLENVVRRLPKRRQRVGRYVPSCPLVNRLVPFFRSVSEPIASTKTIFELPLSIAVRNEQGVRYDPLRPGRAVFVFPHVAPLFPHFRPGEDAIPRFNISQFLGDYPTPHRLLLSIRALVAVLERATVAGGT